MAPPPPPPLTVSPNPPAGISPVVNCLRNRAAAIDTPTWLAIYDDDLEAALARYEESPDDDD